MPKQLINIIGTLVIVLVVVLGVVLGVVPLSSQTGQVHAEATTVRQSNDIFDAQVRQLKAVKKPELESRLAGLRKEIPEVALNDDIFELINAAAAATASTVESVTATEPEAWVTPVVEGEEPAPAADAPAAEDAPEGDEVAAATEDAPVPATPADSPRKSLPFAIQVTAADMSLAAAFVDALRAAPRLVRIETVAFTQNAAVAEDAVPTVSVSVALRSLVLSGK